jgi:MinD-like ATPase involved in chromosome partitioning or flagellar assembly
MSDIFDGADRVETYKEATGSRIDRKALQAEFAATTPPPSKPTRKLLNKKAWEQYARDLEQWKRDVRDARLRDSPWPRAMNVLVTNKKGSSGKTPTTLCTAGALATILGGGVAVFEAADTVGTLLSRAEGTATKGLVEMLRNADQLTSRAAVESYGLKQSSGAMVYGSVGRRRPWSGADVDTMREILDMQFLVTIADSANNEMSAAFGAALQGADVLVIPTAMSFDSVSAVIETLDFIDNKDESGLIPYRPDLWDRTIVVVSPDGRVEDPEVSAKVVEVLRKQGITVVRVPYDDHLAEGRTISWNLLSDESRLAWSEVAHLVGEKLHLAITTN